MSKTVPPVRVVRNASLSRAIYSSSLSWRLRSCTETCDVRRRTGNHRHIAPATRRSIRSRTWRTGRSCERASPASIMMPASTRPRRRCCRRRPRSSLPVGRAPSPSCNRSPPSCRSPGTRCRRSKRKAGRRDTLNPSASQSFISFAALALKGNRGHFLLLAAEARTISGTRSRGGVTAEQTCDRAKEQKERITASRHAFLFAGTNGAPHRTLGQSCVIGARRGLATDDA